MTEFRVYFQQINQTYYDVEATDENTARFLAKKEWRKEHGPEIIIVEKH